LIPDEVEVVEGPALAVDPEVGEDAEEESRWSRERFEERPAGRFDESDGSNDISLQNYPVSSSSVTTVRFWKAASDSKFRIHHHQVVGVSSRLTNHGTSEKLSVSDRLTVSHYLIVSNVTDVTVVSDTVW
jgi:hypothetical protein